MIVLILLSEQMLKLWSWKTWKGLGKGHEKSWNLKVVSTNPELTTKSATDFTILFIHTYIYGQFHMRM